MICILQAVTITNILAPLFRTSIIKIKPARNIHIAAIKEKTRINANF